MRPTCAEDRGRRHIAAVYLILWLLCMPTEVGSSNIIIEEGSTLGVMEVDTQGILQTKYPGVSQVVHIDLSPELKIEQHISKLSLLSDNIKTWYSSHIIQTRNCIRKILSKLENKFISKNGILKAFGASVSRSTTIMNDVGVKEMKRKLHNLMRSIETQQQLQSERVPNDEIFNVVNQTVVIQGLHAEMFKTPKSVHQKPLDDFTALLTFVEPVYTITRNYLMELEIDVNDLINLEIPRYFMSTDIVQDILSTQHNVNLDDIQIRASLRMGCAIPMYPDIENLHLSFFLHLPLF